MWSPYQIWFSESGVKELLWPAKNIISTPEHLQYQVKHQFQARPLHPRPMPDLTDALMSECQNCEHFAVQCRQIHYFLVESCHIAEDNLELTHLLFKNNHWNSAQGQTYVLTTRQPRSSAKTTGIKQMSSAQTPMASFNYSSLQMPAWCIPIFKQKGLDEILWMIDP